MGTNGKRLPVASFGIINVIFNTSLIWQIRLNFQNGKTRLAHLAIYVFRKIWQNVGYFLLFKIPDKLPKRFFWSTRQISMKKVEFLGNFWSTKRSQCIRYWHVPYYPQITVLCLVWEYKKVTMYKYCLEFEKTFIEMNCGKKENTLKCKITKSTLLQV